MTAITIDGMRRADNEHLVLAARDTEGYLDICVAHDLWEQLQTEAPVDCDAGDRRDYALGLIEHRAGLIPASRSAVGERYVVVD